MFWPPGELTVSEAYVYDDFDVEGDLEAVFPLADHLLAREAGLTERLRALRRLHALPSGRQSRVRPGARPARRPALLARARPAGDRVPLRRFERVLRAVARLRDGVLVRRFRIAGPMTSRPPSDGSSSTCAASFACGRASVCSTSAPAGAASSCTPCRTSAWRRSASRSRGTQAEFASKRIREAGLADRCRIELRDYRAVDSRKGSTSSSASGCTNTSRKTRSRATSPMPDGC